MDTIDAIMNLAELEHDVALGALQEALSLLSESDQQKVLAYINSTED